MQSNCASHLLLAALLFGIHLVLADSNDPVILSKSGNSIDAMLAPVTPENGTTLDKRYSIWDRRCDYTEFYHEEESYCLTTTIIEARCVSRRLGMTAWYRTECPRNTHCLQTYEDEVVEDPDDVPMRTLHASCTRNALEVALDRLTVARISFNQGAGGSAGRELLQTEVQYWEADPSSNATVTAEDTQFLSLPDAVLRGDFRNVRNATSQPINITLDKAVNVTMVPGSHNKNPLVALIFWKWAPVS